MYLIRCDMQGTNKRRGLRVCLVCAVCTSNVASLSDLKQRGVKDQMSLLHSGWMMVFLGSVCLFRLAKFVVYVCAGRVLVKVSWDTHYSV